MFTGEVPGLAVMLTGTGAQGTSNGVIGDDGEGGLQGSYTLNLEGVYDLGVTVLGSAITDDEWTNRQTVVQPGLVSVDATTAAGSGLLNARMGVAAEFTITTR